MNATDTFERQAVLLEDLHRAARELSEVAGDSIAITIQTAEVRLAEQRRLEEADQLEARVAELEKQLAGGDDDETSPGSRAPSVRADRTQGHSTASAPPGEDTLTQQIVGVLAEIEPASPTKVARRLGMSTSDGRRWNELKELMPTLAAQGVLAVDKLVRGHPTYRRGPACRDPLPGGASSNGQPAETPDDRAERVVESLRLEASTLTELCLHTGIPRRDVKTIVRDLEAAGRVVQCGHRFPQRHVVYGVAE